jgi:uncharacterized integral membrane protein
MPWRLIGFILLFGIFVIFIASNLDNRCNIGFGPWERENVPVFLTAFVSFALGLFCAIPFIISFGRKKKEKGKPEAPLPKDRKKKAKSPELPDISPPPPGENTYGVD